MRRAPLTFAGVTVLEWSRDVTEGGRRNRSNRCRPRRPRTSRPWNHRRIRRRVRLGSYRHRALRYRREGDRVRAGLPSKSGMEVMAPLTDTQSSPREPS